MNHLPRDLTPTDLEIALTSPYITGDTRSQLIAEHLRRKQADQDATKDLNIN